MGKVHVRVQCPMCGMQVSQNRMSRDYLPVKMSTFEVENLGRNKGGFKWLKNVKVSGREVLLLLLKNKLERLLAAINLEMTSGSEKMVRSVGVTSALLSSQTRMATSNSRLIKTEGVMSLPSLML